MFESGCKGMMFQENRLFYLVQLFYLFNPTILSIWSNFYQSLLLTGKPSGCFMAASTSLRSIPGIKGPSACAIIAELGVDMSAFQSPAHLVSWAGLKPMNDESAGKIKSRRITHWNKYLRKTLIECALAAVRTKGFHFSRFSYHQTVELATHKLE